MDKEKYLKRINFNEKIVDDHKTLLKLHENHVFHIPFENLDIHYRRRFDLEIESIYEKVVLNFRGGFCYELNNVFNALLRQVGFNSRIISARIVDESGKIGPEYDHMAVCIETDNKRYLADVGYGDLFTRPLEIRDGIQTDGRNRFMIQRVNDQDFVLSMSSDEVNIYEKYQFSLSEVTVEKFTGICLDKQTNPSSYFVKNIICTKPTELGRLTLLNDKLIEKKNNERVERQIHNDDELRLALRINFGIVIK